LPSALEAASSIDVHSRSRRRGGLAQFNAAFKGSGVNISITEEARKEQVAFAGRAEKRDVSAETSSSSEQSPAELVTLLIGEKVARNDLLEWEVLFNWQGDWPSVARPAFDAFPAAPPGDAGTHGRLDHSARRLRGAT